MKHFLNKKNRVRQSKGMNEIYLKDSHQTEERSIKVLELNICEDILAKLVDEQKRLEEDHIRIIEKEIECNLICLKSIRKELAVDTVNNDSLNNRKTPAKYMTEDRKPLAKNNTDDRKPSGEKQQKKSVLN